jgi:hypothetical protein
VPAEFRLYNHLFTVEAPGDDSWEAELNPASLEVKPLGLGERLHLGMRGWVGVVGGCCVLSTGPMP